MPVHGPSKVESKCLTMCSRVEPFLSLGRRGTGGQGKAPPTYFWQELASNHEAVSNYLVCLIVKLISLDSEHGLKPLVSVYRDLVELPVDQSKYRAWASKPIPTNARTTALELQYAIISTIYFLTEFYSYRPTIHLRHIYLRWNLARNYSGDGSGKLADPFEEKIISPFSVAQSKDVVTSPQSSFSLGEREDAKLVSRLIDGCCQNHRRAYFGVLPPEVSKLCLNSTVSEALAYVRLQGMLVGSFVVGAPAVQHLLAALRKEAMHGHNTEQGDREGLLPLLQLLKDCITMMLPVDRAEAYQTVMPFYMWPVAHAECGRRVLSLLAQEGKVRGTSFRRKLLVESNLKLNLRNTEIRGQFVRMLVDVSNPQTHGTQFSDVFMNRQDVSSTESLHRMIIRNCFKSVFPTQEMVELETRLQRLSTSLLATVCCECVEVMEGGVGREEEDGEKIQLDLATEINRLHKIIIQETETDEQRDSAVSCGGLDGSYQHSEEALGIFSMPSPDIPTHPLDLCQYPVVQAKLREILVQCQKQLSPAVAPRSFSRSSQTSMDSTGSGHMDAETKTQSGGEEGGENVDAGRHGGLESSEPQEVLSNGHSGRGRGEGGEELCDSHAASPDSGHVVSPDPVTPLTPPPIPNGATKKKHRSLSTEAALTPTQSRELNGEASPNSSDEIFDNSSQASSQETEHLSPDHSSQARNRAKSFQFIRRKTVPANIHKHMSTISTDSTSSSTSVISPTPSFVRSRKGYTNVAGTPLNIVPIGSVRLSGRRPSMAVAQRKKGPLAGAGSPVHSSMPKVRVLKIVLAGGDLLVCHMSKAYAYLLAEEPNLFVGLDIRFYHVPLTTASGADWQIPERNVTTTSDLPEIHLEQLKTCASDVNIGRYMSHLDSWYERNVALAVHHSLRLLPGSFKPTSQLENQQLRPPLVPAKVLIDSVAHYLREANHCIKAKMYRIKMLLKAEKSHKIDHREMYMMHRLDIQRLSGKKNNRQVKLFEANIQMTELSLDGSFVRTDMTQVKDVWTVRASNIPCSSDPTVANPESECFELSIMTVHEEGSRFTKSRLMEQAHHHTYDLALETRKEPLTVVVDGDNDTLIENVIRLEITPANMDSGLPALSQAGMAAGSGIKNDSRPDRHLFFPLMTFWPVDL